MQTSSRLTAAALLALALAPCLALAQDEKPAKPEPPAAQQPQKAPKPEPRPYSLSLTIKETDAGKPALEKSYVLILIADDSQYNYQSLRDGDRIPYTGEKGREYFDIGTSIDVNQAKRLGETLVLSLRADSSSLTAKSNGVDLPQINQWRCSVTAFLVPGKATVVYSTSNAITGHAVEILATARPLETK